jgi:sugar/nucleoside kinase (ribokinase family)
MSGSETADVIVAGQIARDLVLVVDDVPGAGQSAAVRQRREMLGGKGANQAVALAQLGMRVALLGVVGDALTCWRWPMWSGPMRERPRY